MDVEKTKLLKQVSVMYVEDEQSVRQTVQFILEKVTKKCYIASDGDEALRLFQQLQSQGESIDIVLTDINMPNMDGITLVKQIKKLSDDVEFILATAVNHTSVLIDAINLKVANYVLKPIKMDFLIDVLVKITENYLQKKVINNQYYELEQYLEVINKVAIISKTDLKGNIIEVNDIFCQVSGYSQEELIGSPHSIVRHPDTPKEVFRKMWSDIQNDKTWKGKIKNMAKDGSDYYTFANIFPLFDSQSGEKISYIGIRYVITQEEMSKQQFKKKVLKNLSDSRRKEKELYEQIKHYQNELQQVDYIDFIKGNLENEQKRVAKLKSQLSVTEIEVKNVREKFTKKLEDANANLSENYNQLNQLKIKYETSKGTNKKLEEEIKAKEEQIVSLEQQVKRHIHTIEDLKDVINHREDEIRLLKEGK